MRLVLFGCGCSIVQGEPNVDSLKAKTLTIGPNLGIGKCSKGKGDEGWKRATQLFERELQVICLFCGLESVLTSSKQAIPQKYRDAESRETAGGDS